MESRVTGCEDLWPRPSGALEPLRSGLALKEGLAGRKGHTSASIQTFRAAGAKPGLGQASQGGGGSDESPVSPTHRLLCVPAASPRSGAGGARGHPLWEPAVLHEAGAGPGPGHAGSLALSEQPAESEFRAPCVVREGACWTHCASISPSGSGGGGRTRWLGRLSIQQSSGACGAPPWSGVRHLVSWL